MVTFVLVAIGVALLAAFVLAPLVQSEENLNPIRRPRPGTRHLHGLDSEDIDLSEPEERECPHCGARVDTAFTYCGQCCSPLL